MYSTACMQEGGGESERGGDGDESLPGVGERCSHGAGECSPPLRHPLTYTHTYLPIWLSLLPQNPTPALLYSRSKDREKNAFSAGAKRLLLTGKARSRRRRPAGRRGGGFAACGNRAAREIWPEEKRKDLCMLSSARWKGGPNIEESTVSDFQVRTRRRKFPKRKMT